MEENDIRKYHSKENFTTASEIKYYQIMLPDYILINIDIHLQVILNKS